MTPIGSCFERVQFPRPQASFAWTGRARFTDQVNRIFRQPQSPADAEQLLSVQTFKKIHQIFRCFRRRIGSVGITRKIFPPG